jgi:hypothetical protein
MPPSGILCHVALVRTDVSVELITSIIRVTSISELGTLAVTSNQSMLRRNTMSTATWCNIPEDGILQSHHCKNLKFYIEKSMFNKILL